MERIVFDNNELKKAIADGVCEIYLCDNDFLLPDIKNTAFTIIGDVNVKASSEAKCKECGMVFRNFIPRFLNDKNSEFKIINTHNNCDDLCTSYFVSSYKSSYKSSYNGSYYAYFPCSYPAKLVKDRSNVESETYIISINGYGVDLI